MSIKLAYLLYALKFAVVVILVYLFNNLGVSGWHQLAIWVLLGVFVLTDALDTEVR